MSHWIVRRWGIRKIIIRIRNLRMLTDWKLLLALAPMMLLLGPPGSGTREMLATHLLDEHPEWGVERIQQEVSRRMSHGTV